MQKQRYQICPATDTTDWDIQLRQTSLCNAFHTQTWAGILQQHFPRLQPVFLEILRDNIPVGFLPCYLFRPFPFVSMLHSLHWNLPGGPILWNNRTIDTAALTEAIVTAFHSVASRHHLTEVVLNSSPFGSPLDESSLHRLEFEPHGSRFTHLLNIEQGYDAVWTAYNKRIRGAVRKAAKNGVSVRMSQSEQEMQVFYAMYLSMMRHFGSPPKPYALLNTLRNSPIGDLVVAEYEGQIIGGLLFVYFNKIATLWVEASLPEYLHLRTNNAVIHFIVRWACEHGYHWVDFGASPPERKGLVAFKEEWRAERFDFQCYRWMRSPWRYRFWTQMEPALRCVYSWIQRWKTRKHSA